MVVYSLREDISGDMYRDFISYCLEHSTFFSLTCYSYNIGKDTNSFFRQELNDYFYKSFQTSIWYYHKITGGKLDIRLYHSHPSLVDFFVKQYGSLFHFHQGSGREDICFFSNDQLLFGSITHEHFAEMHQLSQINPEDFQKFAKWKKRTLIPKEYEFLPDFKKFL